MATVVRPAVALPDPGDDIDAEQVRDWTNNILTFLEGTNIDEANVDLSGADGIMGKSTAQVVTGLKSFESAAAAAGGVREVAQFGLNPASGTAANEDGGRLALYADDDGGTKSSIAQIDWILADAAAASEDGRLDFAVSLATTMGVMYSMGNSLAGVSSHTWSLRTAAVGAIQAGFNLEWNPDGDGNMTDGSSGVRLAWRMPDDLDVQNDYGAIDVVCLADAAGAEDARMDFSLADASGAIISQVQLANGSFSPTITDDVSLGTSLLNFSDLFLDSGAVVNFDGGDVTLTHGANVVTVAGGTWATAALTSTTLTALGNVTIGVDDLGYDFQVFGDTTGKYVKWTTATDTLDVQGTFTVNGAAVGGAALTGSTATQITTVTGADAIQGEANLTFDGSTLDVISTSESHIRLTGAQTGSDGSIGKIEGYTTTGTDKVLAKIDFQRNGADNAGGIGFHVNDSASLNQALLIDNASTFLINETANAKMAGPGITINQGANDGEILAVKSSDVAHGITARAETDTYGVLAKSEATSGGLSVRGYKDADGSSGQALQLAGFLGEAADTTKTTAAQGIIDMIVAVKSGTNVAAPGVDSNLVVIRDWNGACRFIFDMEGTGHADVAWTTYDTYDDLSLISTMEDTLLAIESPEQTPRRHAMEATGIIGKGSWHMENGKPKAMVNFTKLSMLHHGALIQAGERFERIEAAHAKEIAELKGQMSLLMEKN